MRWKIGLHFYWWRPAKMKEKQLTEGRGGREKYLEEGRRWADPEDSDFLCRGACVRRLRDDIALAREKLCLFIIFIEALLLYWPGRWDHNGTLEVNLKESLVFFLYNATLFPNIFSRVLDLSNPQVKPAPPFNTTLTSEAIIDTCRQLVSPTASHWFWWDSASQLAAWSTSDQSMGREWPAHRTHLRVWEAN